MILFRQRGIRIAEVWFDEPVPTEGADVVYFTQRADPIPGKRCREKHTLLMDLSNDAESLFSAVNGDTRTKIRRARDKDGILCRAIPPDEANLAAFCALYERFALDKGIHPVSLPYLSAVARTSRLDLSQAFDPSSGEVLVWHAHLLSPRRARLLYSASLFRDSEDNQRRNMMGRANRYLHWSDVLRFKAMPLDVYDWGGWYAGTTDDAKLRINRFKEEFGGSVVKEWNGEVGVTWLGKVALTLRRMLDGSE